MQNPREKLGGSCDQTCFDDGTKLECEGGGIGAIKGTCRVEDGLQCLNGSCQAIGQIGDDCVTLGCVAGAYCKQPDDKCAPKLPDGAACESPSVTSGYECASGTCKQSKCTPNWPVSDNTCSG